MRDFQYDQQSNDGCQPICTASSIDRSRRRSTFLVEANLNLDGPYDLTGPLQAEIPRASYPVSEGEAYPGPTPDVVLSRRNSAGARRLIVCALCAPSRAAAIGRKKARVSATPVALPGRGASPIGLGCSYVYMYDSATGTNTSSGYAHEEVRRSARLPLGTPSTWRVHLDPLPCALVHKRFPGVSLIRVESRNMWG